MSGATARNDLELRMMESMVDGAYALGMGFAEAAQAETGFDRQMTLTDAFHRCFHAVRMGIRLSITLRAAPKPSANDEREVTERETVRDRPSRDRDYDRDRQDYEPVSLARFLATLRGVTRDAERLQVGDPAPLQSLLAEVDAGPANTNLVMAGLVPATQTHRPLRTELSLSAAPTPLPPAHLGGRDKPGHDELRGKARYLGSAVSIAPISAHPPRPRRGGASQSGDPGFFR